MSTKEETAITMTRITNSKASNNTSTNKSISR